MIVAAHQPSYLPWLGYLDKLAKADLFVVMDDLQYEAQNFHNRNRIKLADGPHWLTVPLIRGAQTDRVIDKRIDNTGRGHDATCVTACPALVAGKIGNGYDFIATSNHALTVPDSLDFRGTFTVAAWMNARMLGANNLSVLAKAVGVDTSNSWQLEIVGTSRKLSFTGGSQHYLESPAVISLGAWHHVAGTWDGTTKRLYVDGALVSSIASTVTYDRHAVYLGADENNGVLALPFDGVLDDLRVYNRALPAAELAALAK